MLVYPAYYKIAERKKNGWLFHGMSVFYREASGSAVDLNDIRKLWGISYEQLAIAFLVINGGREGFYLANLKSKEYCYCGLELEDVRVKLYELGIGRPDPVVS